MRERVVRKYEIQKLSFSAEIDVFDKPPTTQFRILIIKIIHLKTTSAQTNGNQTDKILKRRLRNMLPNTGTPQDQSLQPRNTFFESVFRNKMQILITRQVHNSQFRQIRERQSGHCIQSRTIHKLIISDVQMAHRVPRHDISGVCLTLSCFHDVDNGSGGGGFCVLVFVGFTFVGSS